MLKSAPSLLLAGALNACTSNTPEIPYGSATIDPVLIDHSDSFKQIKGGASIEDPKTAEVAELAMQLKADHKSTLVF